VRGHAALPRPTPPHGAQIESWPYEELDGPLYNIRDLMQPPGQRAGRGPFAAALTGARPPQLAAPPAEQLQEGAPVPDEVAPPYPGAERVLQWSTQIVLSAGYDQRHPLSNKVEVTLQLRALAREVGLSPAGVAHIAALCGPRRVAAAA
jgi:hypothetical protein